MLYNTLKSKAELNDICEQLLSQIDLRKSSVS